MDYLQGTPVYQDRPEYRLVMKAILAVAEYRRSRLADVSGAARRCTKSTVGKE